MKGMLGAPIAPPAGRPVPGGFGGRRLPVLVALLLAVVVGLVAWTVVERRGDGHPQPLPERAGASAARSEGERRNSIAFVRDDGVYVMRSDGSGIRALRRGGVAAGARDLAWSPDGRRLALTSRGGIWVMSGDGSGLVRVVDAGGSPTWSPDGRRVAFDAGGVRVVNADGSGGRLLVKTNAGMLDWSPDGRRIAFVRLAEGMVASLYVVGVDGGNLRRLTPGSAGGIDPDWSPDGRSVAFRRRGGELYLATPDGGSQVRLTRTTGTDIRDGQPSWSPDGGRIAFVRKHWRQEAGSAELYVINADGSGLRRLTANGIAEQSPAWRPEPTSERILGGRRLRESAPGVIAFARSDGIYAMRPDGTDIRALRRGGPASSAAALAWSPDGRRLAFLSGLPPQQSLWVMGADGRHVVRLASATSAAGEFLGPPAWSPDGTLLAYTAKRAGAAVALPAERVDRDVWVVNADGSDRRPLRRTPKQWEGEVDWNPTGGRILYTDLTGWTSRIRVVRTSGLDERLLTWEWDFQAIDPHWAPDGRTILFMHPAESPKPATEELYLLDPENGERLRLTTNNVSDRDPRWSPDGRRIVFVRGDEDPFCMICGPLPNRGRSEISVMNADGTGAVRLTHNRLAEADPAWQPVPRSAAGSRSSP